MTLITRPKPPSNHKKRSGQHHRHSHHYVKTYWPYLPMLLVVLGGLLLNSAWPQGKHGVLGYATDMSVQNLLTDTNSQRANNSEGALTLNAKLDNAAQAKANDMAARDYWSHDTPDGKTPWTFITAAGYSYTTAGENLAYGFNTASDTLTGWMNSSEHRANILNTTYRDIGFGIANSPNYQGSGPQTIVVAMYGSSPTSSVAATAPTQQPTPKAHASPTPTSTPIATTTPATSVQSKTSNTPQTPTPVANTKPAEAATPRVSTTEPASKPVARVQLLTDGQAPWSAFAISLISSTVVLIFLLRHGLAWRRVWAKSEAFVLHHPLLDVALVAVATLGFLLTRSSGVIR